MNQAYQEPQWTPITILVSQMVQAFNLEGNQDLVREFGRPYRSVESVLLQAVDRISQAMGPEWTIRAKQLIMSDNLISALHATQKVLEEITKD